MPYFSGSIKSLQSRMQKIFTRSLLSRKNIFIVRRYTTPQRTLLINESNFESTCKKIVDVLSEEQSSTYEETKQLLNHMDYYVEHIQHNGDISHDKWLIQKKSFVAKCIATLQSRLGDYSSSIDACDRLLALENDMKQLNMLDDAFWELNYAASLKVEMLASLEDYTQAIELQNFTIENRIKQRLNRTQDKQQREVLLYTLYDEIYNLAELYYESEDFTNALDHIDDYLKNTYSNEGQLLKAKTLFQLDKHDEAYENALDLIQVSNDENIVNEARVIVANCLINKESYQRAIDVLNKVIQSDEENVTAYELLATCYFEISNYKKALETFKILVSLSEESLLEIYEPYTKTLMSMGQIDDLVVVAGKIDEMVKSGNYSIPEESSDHLTIVLPMAQYEQAKWIGRFKDALKILNIQEHEQQVIAVNSLRLEKIEILIRLKRYNQAQTLLNESAKLFEENWDEKFTATLLSAKIHAYNGNNNLASDELKKANQMLNKLKAIDQEHTFRYKMTSAIVLGQQKSEKEEAIALLRECLSQIHLTVPDRVATLEQLYLLEKEIGHDEPASEYLQKILKYVPNHFIYSRQLSSISGES
jgi:tetratricopeptide (TPR) repeat protein